MKTVFYILQLFCLCLFCSCAWAEQDIKFYTQVEPSSGSINDIYTFSVILEGAQPSGRPQLKGGDDFKVSYIGPQSSVNIVNGEVSYQSIFTYRLSPTKEGVLKTPLAQLEAGAESYQSDPLEVKVSKAGTSENVKGTEKLFVRQQNDRNEVYIGEQLVNTLALYSAYRIVNPKLDDHTFDGFRQEPLGKDYQSTKSINGEAYQVLQMKRVLFPFKTGKLIIPKREISAQVATRRRNSYDPFDQDIFDSFFGSVQYKDVNLVSNELEVIVKELPKTNETLHVWNEIPVGETSLELTYSKDDIELGSSKTFELKILSMGNLAPIKDIPLSSKNSYRFYQETPISQSIEKAGNLLSKKTFKFSIVPTRPGPIRIAPLELTYFDLQSESYKTLTTQEISFLVSGSNPQTSSAPSALTPSPIEATPEPIEHYQNKSFFELFRERISTSMLLLILSSFAAFIIFVIGLSRLRGQVKQKSAQVASIKSAKNAADLALAFKQYLNLKLNLAESTLSSDALKSLILDRVKDQALSFEMRSILESLDTMLYGGSSAAKDELDSLKQRITTLMSLNINPAPLIFEKNQWQ